MSSLLRFLHFSASTATNRHDSHRAGLGIVGFLDALIHEHNLPLRTEYRWALPVVADRAAAPALLDGADMIVVGSPTYGQGSPWFVRRFFELTTSCALWGKLGTAWATAGGQHTGGETVVADTLRSLQGLGACTFSFAQKTTVFGTNQKFLADGVFDLIDVWFMDQFARTIALQAMARREPGENWAGRFGLEVNYYRNFPTEAQMAVQLGNWRDLLNAPLSGDPSAAYHALTAKLGFDATPPSAASLPFADWMAPPDTSRSSVTRA